MTILIGNILAGYIEVYSHRFGEHDIMDSEAQAVSLVDFLFPLEGESSQIISKSFLKGYFCIWGSCINVL